MKLVPEENKMKIKKYVFLILGAILIIGSVTAGVLDVISNVGETDTLNKEDRDTLLAKSGASKINVSIELNCETDGYPDNCLWSAKQDGLINSFNNNLPRWKDNETAYTTEELIAQVQAKIKTRLENYADAVRQREAVKVKQAEGSIVFNEEK